MRKNRPQIILEVFAAVGNASKLAAALKISRAAISHWNRVPIRHIKEISNLTGIPREKLRPDLYD